METSIKGLQKEHEKKCNQLKAFLEERKTDKLNAEGGAIYDLNTEQLGEVKKRNQEIEEISHQIEVLATGLKNSDGRKWDDKPTQRKFDDLATSPKSVRLADAVIESSQFKNAGKFHKNFEVDIDIDVKTLFERSAGYAPANPRSPLVVLSGQIRPTVADYISSYQTTNSIVKWMEETTFTNAADTVAEGGSKPEGASAFTERSATVEKIAVWVPVTEEQLEDVPGVQNLLEDRLTLMLKIKEESQLLTGDGSTPNIRGLLNGSSIQTQAKGSDEVQDAIFKGMTKVRWTAYAEPNLIIMHPNDWQSIRLATDDNGRYIWGDPYLAGDDRLWGKPVLVTPSETENTALVGDFMYCRIARRTGVRVKISDSHSDYFIKNKLAVLVEERLALEIHRSDAFCKVTGI